MAYVSVRASADAATVTPPALSVGNASVVEGTGTRTMELPVTLAETATTAFTVKYTVQGVTAVAGVDFTPESGTLSFKAPNKKSAIPVEQLVAVPVLWDATPGTRTLTLTLSSPTAGATIAHAVGIGTIIVPSGTTPTVNVGDAGIYYGDGGPSRTMDFTVTLSAPLTVATSVDYSLIAGTAVPNDDYASVTAGTVKFAKGATNEQISVTVYPDAFAAPNRVFYLDLTTPKKIVLGRAQGIGAMIDDGTEIVTPLDPSYHEATMTADRSSAPPTAFDTYGITNTNGTTVVDAPTANAGGNSRVMFWPAAEQPTADQESCAQWQGEGPSGLGFTDQQGVALRISTVNGVTRAISVTKNVYGSTNFVFNVHVWDTSVPGVYTQIGSFNLRSVFVVGAALVPFPWDICAEAVGNTVSFEVWIDGQPEPAFGNTINGGSVTLPAGYDVPGYAGWYAGHIAAGDSLYYDNLTTGPPPPPATLPGAPSAVSAVAGDGLAQVSWTPPASNGSAITNYTVTANDETNPTNGGQTVFSTGSPATVTGLTNGDTYTFTVTATNGVGTGPASVPSNPIMPTAPPSAPTGVAAVAGNSSALVGWTPSTANGSAISGYTVTAVDQTNPANGGETAFSTGSPATVTGLTNGDTYTFTVTATNGVGTGPASAGSNPVVPSTVPDAPSDVAAAPDSADDPGVLVASFVPGFDEGSAVTGYTVTITDLTNPGDVNNGATVGGTGSPVTITGLTSGDTYSFTVTATNGDGTGSASAASEGVASP